MSVSNYYRIGDPEVSSEIFRREDIEADDPLFPEWENDWSCWVLIMKQNSQNNINFDQRNTTGFVKKKNIFKREFLWERIPSCGIYELKADDKVMYVGFKAAPSRKEPTMLDRIKFCAAKKFHRRNLIDDALQNGYDIWVRMKYSSNAESDKMKILLKYDFPWNECKPARTVPQ